MSRKISKISQKLGKLSQWKILGLAGMLVVIIFVIDLFIKIDLSLAIFYLFPILLVTWFINKNLGIVFSIICSIAWFQADVASKQYPYQWVPYWNAGVRLGFFWVITYLLSDLKIAYEQEKQLARLDPLTGTVNRRYFKLLLQLEINRNLRYEHPFTLVYFDIDNFKTVNDQWGHSKGDYLLETITKIINQHIRKSDILGRLGGDEFGLLLPETDYEAAQQVLQRVQKQILIFIELEHWPISLSIGAMTYQSCSLSADQSLEQVDHLMYEVKHQGKNGINHQVIDKTNTLE